MAISNLNLLVPDVVQSMADGDVLPVTNNLIYKELLLPTNIEELKTIMSSKTEDWWLQRPITMKLKKKILLELYQFHAIVIYIYKQFVIEIGII